MRNEELCRDIDMYTIKGEIIKRTKKAIEKIEQSRNLLIKETSNYNKHGGYKIKSLKKAIHRMEITYEQHRKT